MPTVAGESLPKGKPGPGTLAATASCVLGEISAVLHTGASSNHHKTSHHIWLHLVWVCIEEIASFSNDHQSLSHLEQGSSYAMRCPHNHIFWRASTFLVERFVQTEQKSFMTLARRFLSMTTWRCLGFWKCKNCRERAGGMHSLSMHTMNFPSRSCRCCRPEILLGAAEVLSGLWLQTKTFIPLQASLVFLLSSLSFCTPGEQNQPRIYWWKWLFQTPRIPQHAAGKQNWG